MSALTFTLKATVTDSVDCKTLTPNHLKDQSIADINAMLLGKLTVADVFDVTGDDASHVVFNNTNAQLHYIGYQMENGTITVNGNAGDFIGAAMKGGVLVCKGNVGERCGDLMRRGLLLVEGNTGEYCASNMRAGTLGVLGKTNARLGYGMKRGTLLLAQAPTEQATWLDCGLHTLPFLNTLYQSFQTIDSAFAQLNSLRVQRFMGDAAGMGKAEILVIQA